MKQIYLVCHYVSFWTVSWKKSVGLPSVLTYSTLRQFRNSIVSSPCLPPPPPSAPPISSNPSFHSHVLHFPKEFPPTCYHKGTSVMLILNIRAHLTRNFKSIDRISTSARNLILDAVPCNKLCATTLSFSCTET